MDITAPASHIYNLINNPLDDLPPRPETTTATQDEEGLVVDSFHFEIYSRLHDLEVERTRITRTLTIDESYRNQALTKISDAIYQLNWYFDGVIAKSSANWTVVKPKRFTNYNEELYKTLCEFKRQGQPKPTALAVIKHWGKATPQGISVKGNSFKYTNADGVEKNVDLECLRKSINRLLT